MSIRSVTSATSPLSRALPSWASAETQCSSGIWAIASRTGSVRSKPTEKLIRPSRARSKRPWVAAAESQRRTISASVAISAPPRPPSDGGAGGRALRSGPPTRRRSGAHPRLRCASGAINGGPSPAPRRRRQLPPSASSPTRSPVPGRAFPLVREQRYREPSSGSSLLGA